MEIIKSQKQLKRALFSKKESLSPKEIFLSDAYKEFLTQMTKGFVKDFSGSSYVYDGSSEEVAYTEGLDTHINFNSEMASSLDVSNKNKLFKGLNLHELGHLLLTDFVLLQRIADKLLNENILYPSFEAENKEELEEFAKKNPLVAFKIFQSLQNAIEDGYVDRVMMAKTPGYGPYLKFVRELDFKHVPTYKEQREMEYPTSAIFHNLVLEYARWGIRGYDETDNDEFIETFKECETIISNAVFETLPRSRFIAAWKIFVILFHFIKEEMDKKEDEEKGEGEGEGESSDPSEKEGSEKGKDKKKSDEKKSESGSDKEKSDSSSSSEEGESKEEGSSSSSLEKAMEDLADKTPKESTVRHGTPTTPSKEAMRVASDLLKKEMSEEGEEKESEKPSKEESKDKSKSPAEDKELEKLKDAVAKEKVDADQEKAIKDELSKDKEKDSVGIHKKVESSIQRATKDRTGEIRYENEHEELDKIVKRFIRDFIKEIEDRQIGSTQKGLYFGKYLTIDQVYRKDKKIFNNKIAPENIPDLGVGILVDLSGSMFGEKMDRARECAYITYQFCQALEIPCFVIGHSVNYETRKVEFQCVADENNLDKQDAKRIFSLDAYGDNRDGFALRFCYRKLEKIPADTKLLLVISDGAPADGTSRGVYYSMSNGPADMKQAVSEALKKGMKTVVAGLGYDAPRIKTCYKEGVSEQNSAQFLDMTDINKMPRAFIKILKSYLE